VEQAVLDETAPLPKRRAARYGGRPTNTVNYSSELPLARGVHFG
jgi:hypothetical protein